MPDSNLPSNTPQFTTAEYSQTSGGDSCVACKQPITTRYYRVNNKIACEGCAQQFERQMPKDSHAAYVRGILFGVGAAILGMIGYAGFTIVTGIYIGYISLAVGWLVGKAVMLGSKGIGGRRYQIAAAVLTYAAVSIAAIPIEISYRAKNPSGPSSVQSRQQQPSANDQGGNTPPEQTKTESRPNVGAAIMQLLLLGLASPFLQLQNPVFGIIGLVILAVGIRFAWRITAGSARANIDGPFEVSSAASV